jgi:hypothetical protein
MGRRGTSSLTVVAALTGLIALAASPGLAQAAPPTSTPPRNEAQPSAPATAPTTKPTTASKPEAGDVVERARVHYERGLQLFNEENYDAALFEFERAYELAPSYKILYNMGRIQRQQNNYAAAIRSYARYLREGGAGVPADRRAEVEAEIGVLKPRVAAVKVTVNVDGADVYADDIPVCSATIESSCVGKSPLQAPIIVNGGRHKITATKPGYAPATALVSVVGSDAIDVKLDLAIYAQPAAPPRRVPWGGWIATGVLAAGAGAFGYLALSQSSKLESDLTQPNADPDALDSRSSRTKTFGLVADGLAISAVVVGAISLYYTIKWGKEQPSDSRPKAAAGLKPAKSFTVTPSFTGAAFTF